MRLTINNCVLTHHCSRRTRNYHILQGKSPIERTVELVSMQRQTKKKKTYVCIRNVLINKQRREISRKVNVKSLYTHFFKETQL